MQAEWLPQICIAVFGTLGVALSQFQDIKYRRWSCISGLLSQPFWFMSAWEAGQVGVLFITAIYTSAWSVGLYSFWIRPKVEKSYE